MPEQAQRYRRRLTAQQKDESQDNHDRRRFVRQQPSDLLRSLTRAKLPNLIPRQIFQLYGTSFTSFNVLTTAGSKLPNSFDVGFVLGTPSSLNIKRNKVVCWEGVGSSLVSQLF